jgi:hypothetical protein
LENSNDGNDKRTALENIKEHIKTSAKQSLGLCELKQLNHCLIKNVYGFQIKGSRLKYSP